MSNLSLNNGGRIKQHLICVTDEMANFYYDHLLSELKEKFNLTDFSNKVVNSALKKYGVKLRTASETSKLSNEVKRRKTEEKETELINSIDPNRLEEYYKTHTNKSTIKEFNFDSAYSLYRVLDRLGIQKHTDGETYILAEQIGIEDAVTAVKESTKKKAEDTCLKRYGVKRYRNSEQIQQTCIERYGCVSPLGNKTVRDKAKSTLIDRYGVENSFQIPEVKDRIRQVQTDRYGGIGWGSEELKKKFSNSIYNKYGVNWACQLPQAYNACNGSKSSANNLFENLLLSSNYSFQREFSIDSFRYDFKIDNTLIEINPTATHNINWSPFGEHKGVAIDYHKRKSDTATQNGFRCIHVWDWDDMDKIMNLIKNRKVIYGRNCEVKVVDSRSTKDFLIKNHLQGYVKALVSIALYNNGEMVSVMTFGKPRYNKNYEWELLRYCSSCGVVGGANKMFKYFLKNYNPKSIISYCDRSKFNGDIYKEIGFKLIKSTPPNRHWYNLKTHKHITDNLLRQRGFDQLFGTDFGKGTSNEELMRENGFLELYDCGQFVFVYSLATQ